MPSQRGPLTFNVGDEHFTRFPLLRITSALSLRAGETSLSHCYPKQFGHRPMAAHWILAANRVHHDLPTQDSQLNLAQ